MANAFNKEETVMFEDLIMGFDSDNICAKQSSVFRPGESQTERSGDTYWRPQPYISTTVSGRSVVDGDFTGLTQLAVPTTADIAENVLWDLNAWELRDPLQRERKIDSAKQTLSAVVNRAIAEVVALQGSLVVVDAGAATGYDDIATAEARMGNEEIGLEKQRTYLANMTDYKNVAANLANRETMMGKPNTAYTLSFVGPVAGFDTFRTSFQPTLLGSAAATTVNGAQSYIPLATQPNAINGGESNVDNRTMDLTVAASAGFVVGDAITIAGVNAASMINKEDIGELRTFRVTDVPDGTTLTITPPVIDIAGANQSEKEYGNCTSPAPNAAAITVINTTTARVNSFWCRDSIEIFAAPVAIPASDMPGLATMRGQTDSGIEIVLAKQGGINDLNAKYRFLINFGVANLQPQMNGIQLFNQ